MDLFNIYSQSNKRRSILAALAMTAVIAFADWLITPYIAIGFLYLFPIILISGFLRREQIVVFAVICAVLQEMFSNLPASDELTRLVLSLTGFAGTGLFLHEIVCNRQMAVEHLTKIEAQIQLRRDAEEQLRVLVESSPAAILTLDENGEILLANESAQQIFASGERELAGQSVANYLPTLYSIAVSSRAQPLHTAMQCRGRRSHGEVFLAGIWFSTYTTFTGRKLAAIIVDLSDDLRDREDLSLEYLLKNAHILMGGITHEIRNLSGAADVFYQNLQHKGVLAEDQDFGALGALIEGLSKLSMVELLPVSRPHELPVVELSSVMDELHILLRSTFRDSGIELDWQVADDLPMVAADRYSLTQVFLNLTKNSRRAMEGSLHKVFLVESKVLSTAVEIRLKDSGPGITNSQYLFRPFQRNADSTGLGLYMSRTLMRSFGGDLVHEPSKEGCCFVLVVPMV